MGKPDRPKRQVTGGYELVEDAKQAVSRYAERKGMVKNELVRRVMLWFASQREPVQTAVVGLVDDGMEEAYATVLEELAADLRQSVPPAKGPVTGLAKLKRDATQPPEAGGHVK